MKVIESARHRLEEAIRQTQLGYRYGESDEAYWSAYLDGANDLKKEFERKIGECLMTIKEASCVLDGMAKDMYLGLKDLGNANPMREVLAQRIEAIERAQDAMRQWEEYLRSMN